MAAIAKQFVDISTSAIDDYKDDHDAHATHANFNFDYDFMVKTMADASSGADLTNDQLKLVSDALDAAYDTHSNSDNYCGYSFDFVTDAINHVNSLIK